MGCCSQLRELYLNANQIEQIPLSISRLSVLNRLEIESNKLETLPCHAIAKMNCLTDIKVDGNPFTQLPFKLKPKTALKQIMSYARETPEPEEVEEDCKVIPPPPPVSEGPTRPAFPVFGVPLQTLMENEYKIFPDIPSPRIVRYAIQFIILHALSIEGIFRLAGENARCVQLREEINNRTDINFRNSENPHNVSSILKQWLRDLPEPVLLYKNYDVVLALNELPEEEQITKLKELLESLPKENYTVARELFRLMYLVSLSAEVNRMDASNIAKVIGPNLLFVPKGQAVDPYSEITKTGQINDVLTLGCQYYPRIFEHNITDIFDHDFLQKEENPGRMFSVMQCKVYAHTKSIISLTLSSDHSLIWSADSKGLFKIWRCKDMSTICKCDTRKKRTNYLARCENKMWLGFDDCIQVRNEETGDLIEEIPENPAYCMSVSDKGKVWIVSVHSLLVIDNQTLEITKVQVEGFPVIVAVVKDKVWVVCSDKTIRIIDQETFEVNGTIDISQCGRLNSLHIIDGLVWAGSDLSSILIWNPETFELKHALEGDHNGKVFGAFPVGDMVWTYAWDARICVYNRATFEFMGALPEYHTDAIAALQCAYDDNLGCWRAITASWDQSLAVWLTPGEKPASTTEDSPKIAPPVNEPVVTELETTSAEEEELPPSDCKDEIPSATDEGTEDAVPSDSTLEATLEENQPLEEENKPLEEKKPNELSEEERLKEERRKKLTQPAQLQDLAGKLPKLVRSGGGCPPPAPRPTPAPRPPPPAVVGPP